jgi:3-phenylpropionate/cinnamic acid dioxygenase small subunit
MELESIVRRWELEQLFTEYVHCLDADELERWPDFFTEDCFYRITSAENYDAGLPLGLIYATSRNMLKDRVSALREANITNRSDTDISSPQSGSSAMRWRDRNTSISWRISWLCAQCKTAR